MDHSKLEHIEIAKKVWELYLSGMDKSTVSRELNINRAEVIHIIKYTTQTLYLSNKESTKILFSLHEDLEKYQYSDIDAYRDNIPTGGKVTYKRLSEIYLKKVEKLTQKLEEYEFSKLSLFGKKIL